MSSRHTEKGGCPDCGGDKDKRAARCRSCREQTAAHRVGQKLIEHRPCKQCGCKARYVTKRGQLKCVECAKARVRRRLGIPEPLTAKPALCECCGNPPGAKSLAIDHDHDTGRFRGWLCHRCNLGIGLLGDTPDGLIQALNYLEERRRV